MPMLPVTPNMLLLGKTSKLFPLMVSTQDDRFCTRLSYIAQVEKEWWERWIKVALLTFLSIKRWKLNYENIKQGKIVMLLYPIHR